MAAHPYESYWATGDEGAERVDFPNALRNDGKADTYVDSAGGLILLPRQPHNFAFSAHLGHEGLSAGKVIDFQGEQAIRFPEEVDLITLPAILNAFARISQGRKDVTHTLRLLGQTMHAMHRKLGALPGLVVVEGVAIDRTADRIELLAPYQVDMAVHPTQVYETLRQDAYQNVRTAGEVALVEQCFAEAYDAFEGGR